MRRQGTPDTLGFFILHEGMIGVVGDEGLVQEGYSGLSDAPLVPGSQTARAIDMPQATEGWLGITDKYWAHGRNP